jgi:hypothetical protein
MNVHDHVEVSGLFAVSSEREHIRVYTMASNLDKGLMVQILDILFFYFEGRSLLASVDHASGTAALSVCADGHRGIT